MPEQPSPLTDADAKFLTGCLWTACVVIGCATVLTVTWMLTK